MKEWYKNNMIQELTNKFKKLNKDTCVEEVEDLINDLTNTVLEACKKVYGEMSDPNKSKKNKNIFKNKEIGTLKGNQKKFTKIINKNLKNTREGIFEEEDTKIWEKIN